MSNAMLAQRISSINSITSLAESSAFCQTSEVQAILKSDPRIGDKYLSPSPGFGGSCFEKDLLSFIYILDQNGEREAAEYWNGVLKINQHQKQRLGKLVVQDLSRIKSDTSLKVALFGFAYKKNTGDTRMS